MSYYYANLHGMTDIDWDDLNIFLHVARSKSFTAAAEQGKWNQSTISRRILNLESTLGVQLFHRSVRGIIPTSAGLSLIGLVSDMEGRVKLIEAKASEEKGLSGRIRLAVSDGIGGYWLPPRMTQFHTLYPGITVEIHCSTTPPPVGTREVDIACSWHRPNHPDAVVFCEAQMTLKPVASIEYLQRYGCPRSLDDLHHHRLCHHLHYPKDNEWEAWYAIIQKSPNVSYQTNSSWALGEATIHGVGISLQPIGIEARENNLRLLDLDGYSVGIQFFLSCHREIKDIPRIRALINYIKSDLFSDGRAGSPFMKQL